MAEREAERFSIPPPVWQQKQTSQPRIHGKPGQVHANERESWSQVQATERTGNKNSSPQIRAGVVNSNTQTHLHTWPADSLPLCGITPAIRLNPRLSAGFRQKALTWLRLSSRLLNASSCQRSLPATAGSPWGEGARMRTYYQHYSGELASQRSAVTMLSK